MRKAPDCVDDIDVCGIIMLERCVVERIPGAVNRTVMFRSDVMKIALIYNVFEIFLWLGFSVVFWVPAFRRGERNRGFCVAGGLAFVWASLSEVVEAYTGAWWRPWWLLVWKASFVFVFVFMFRWYTRITPNWWEKVVGKDKGGVRNGDIE